MALVDYSSSEGEEDDAQAQAHAQVQAQVQHQRPRQPQADHKDEHRHQQSSLPPLPAKFHDLYAHTARISSSDDPSLHGGRRRVTPHIEGNWPTHVYIEWFPSTTEHAALAAVITALRTRLPPDCLSLHSLLTSDLAAPLPLHISLSRSIGFATERKDDFVVAVERAIRSSGVRPFDVVVSSWDWVPNFERTRWFLVLRVTAPRTDGLNKLLHVTNRVVQEHGQPPLYIKTSDGKKLCQSEESMRSRRTPIRGEPDDQWDGMQEVSDAFHVSFAWSLEQPNDAMLDATKSVSVKEFEDVRKALISVEEIKVKVGNVVTKVPLARNVSERTGLLGL